MRERRGADASRDLAFAPVPPPRRSTPRPQASKATTRLARWRLARGLTQQQLAKLTGVSRATLQRLELGEQTNPPLRTLANCALALEVPLEQLIEDEWREWFVFDATDAPAPPASRYPPWEDMLGLIDGAGAEPDPTVEQAD